MLSEQYPAIITAMFSLMVLAGGWWFSKVSRDVDTLRESHVEAQLTKVQLEKLSIEVKSVLMSISRAEAELMKASHAMHLSILDQQRETVREIYRHIAEKEAVLREEIRANRRSSDKNGIHNSI